MNRKSYLYLSAIIFAVVGFSHVLRAAFGVEVRAGDWEFPMAASWVGGVLALALCAWGLRLATMAD